MRSHISDEIDEPAQVHETAVQHSRLPVPLPPPTPPPQTNQLGDLAAIVALSIAFCTLLLLTLRPPLAPAATQLESMELPTRPIWVNNLPFGPRDGLVPDFGQRKR